MDDGIPDEEENLKYSLLGTKKSTGVNYYLKELVAFHLLLLFPYEGELLSLQLNNFN